VGAYTIEATTSDYSVERASVSVTENANIQIDFALHTGRAVVTPATVQVTAPVNQVRTRVLSLANTGSASLTFTINESGGARQTTVSTARVARNPDADPNARDTRGLFGAGVTATGMTPMAAGDVLKSFLPTGMQFAWGVGFTGNVWLSDVSGTFRDVEFTPDGAATGRQFNTPWAISFGADMAYVPSQRLICQVNVGGDNGIYCMDPASGNVVSSITGVFPWSVNSQRGLAYRSDDDSFYIGGWTEGIVYHISGLTSATPGQVLGTCRPGDGSISGLAYNGAAGVLWAATNSPTDTIYELNPDDCTVLSTLAHPQTGGFQGGGLEMDETGNLWMIAQSPNRVFLVDSGVPAFSDVPWLSVRPTTGTVAAGATQALNVTIDTHGLTPGLYLATLYVGTSAAQQRLIRVPVSLFVPDYQQAVNAGAGAYTDTVGDVWAADKKYATGSWGYVQKSNTASTSKTISGTPDPTLFKTQRIDPYAYRFDNVPNGTYQIDLRFAELDQKEKLGKRLFDVIVEDTLVLPAHDIVYEVGRLAAESRTFFIDVADGHMDIRLIPRAGFDLPVINAARITHRNDR
jgi:Malectin domain